MKRQVFKKLTSLLHLDDVAYSLALAHEKHVLSMSHDESGASQTAESSNKN